MQIPLLLLLMSPPYVNSGTTFFQKYLIKHSIIYNTVRIHSHCGYLSPNDYEEQYLKKLEITVKDLAS